MYAHTQHSVEKLKKAQSMEFNHSMHDIGELSSTVKNVVTVTVSWV